MGQQLHRPGTVAIAVVLSAAACAGCSGSGSQPAHGSAAPVAAPSGQGGQTAQATRWWSNSAARVGSVIAAQHPSAVADRLHSSRADYCGMLRQTVTAGHPILPGSTADDPALLTSTKAFVAELQHVAPSAVSDAWRTLGDATLTLVASGGAAAAVSGIDAAAVRKAATAIATDAKRSCGVDLSSRPAK